MKNVPFHMSLPCLSISKTEDFYVNMIGAEIGRHSPRWLDVNLFGNQITFTKAGSFNFTFKTYKFENTVLPSFHFGIIVDKSTWEGLYAKLAKSEFDVMAEVVFLKDRKGEHKSFFIQDPNGHTLEFKCFKKQKEMFLM
ncbi:Metallothiol transferase FosB [Arenibacter antarcticus]|uniref:VOC family protein n=1 Tax=Arenibacter antarcticus TaxID=2040469 RepID=A0ABW5VC34_9FLAO|nr:VOC family protein [Arenibacter sp. H213]MCM4167519.1 bleomycin resistance protein [Arenibacter sp. H213]